MYYILVRNFLDFFRVFGVAVSCQRIIIIVIKEQTAVLWKGGLFGKKIG